MSREEVTRFFKHVDALREKLLETEDFESFVKIAQEEGFNFSVEDLCEAVDSGFTAEELRVVSRAMDGGCIGPQSNLNLISEEVDDVP
jgi:predicted ribosomally synthesized peptide with nif11-like leader